MNAIEHRIVLTHAAANVFYFTGTPQCMLGSNGFVGAGFVQAADGSFSATNHYRPGRSATRTWRDRAALLAWMRRVARSHCFTCPWSVS